MSKECDKHFLFQDLCDCPPNMLQIIEKIKAFAERDEKAFRDYHKLGTTANYYVFADYYYTFGDEELKNIIQEWRKSQPANT